MIQARSGGRRAGLAFGLRAGLLPALVLGLSTALMGGCGLLLRRGAAGGGGAAAAPPKVRVFSEAHVITGIAFQSPYLWASSAAGLVRWNVNTEDTLKLGAAEGLPGETVTAIAVDSLGGLWVATERGVGRVFDGKYVPMPPIAGRVTRIAPQEGGTGAWVAGAWGLTRTDGKKWFDVEEAKNADVLALDLGRDGKSVFAGTRSKGMVWAREDGVRVFGPEQGHDIRDVVGTAATDAGAIAGGRGQTRGRLLVVHGDGIDVLEADADVGLLAVSSVKGEPLVVAGSPERPRLYTLRGIPRGQPAPDGGFRFLPLRKAPDAPRYAVVPVLLQAPPEPTVMAVSGGEIWFGTRAVGVARAAEKAPIYYRSSDLAKGADRLSVACPPKGACLLATGGGAVWAWDDEGFARTHVGEASGASVAAVLNDARGAMLAVSVEAGYRGFVLTRPEGEAWKPYRRIEVGVPGEPVLVRFAVAAPNGNLWVGVGYLDNGQATPFGVVEVDFAKNRSIHHRLYKQNETAPPGALPIPDGVTCMDFDGEVAWFGTPSGALRWKDLAVQTWTENDGLLGEQVNRIVATAGGGAMVVTPDGVGRFDGRAWRFPGDDERRAGRPAAVVLDPRGRMWTATNQGVRLEGPGGPRTFDQENGLVDDEIRDAVVDARGRVWLLGRSSVMLAE